MAIIMVIASGAVLIDRHRAADPSPAEQASTSTLVVFIASSTYHFRGCQDATVTLPSVAAPAHTAPASPVGISHFDTVILQGMNDARAAYGSGSLTSSIDLTSRATSRATYLCTHEFSHAETDSHFAGVDFQWVGENLARYATSSDPSNVFTAFMASLSHKANILDPHYQYVGLADACNITVVLFGGYSR